MSTLTDRLDEEFAEAWRPAKDDAIEGVVVSIGSNDSGWGPYPIVTIQPDKGEPLAFHAFHTVAKLKLQQLKPVVGDRLAVKYTGEKTPKGGGKAYHAYNIVSDKESTFDWDMLGDTGATATEDEKNYAQQAAKRSAEEKKLRDEMDGAPKGAKKQAQPDDEIPF